MENFITTQTKCGQIRGIHCDGYDKYLGIRYASAERFAYAEPVDTGTTFTMPPITAMYVRRTALFTNI